MTQAGAIAILAMLATQAVAGEAPLAGDRELGEYLSSECVTCHQLSGKYEGIPSIVGWPPDSFTGVLTDYREKRRENPVMRSIAVKFTDEEIAALAAYFGSLRPRVTEDKTNEKVAD
jgi:cytochrome c553